MDLRTELSIIIVNYNSTEYTVNAVHSILENLKGLDYEIIVVDNDSKDFDDTRLQQLEAAVTVIRNKNNVGFAGANNLGIARAIGDHVLLLNADTKVMGDALQNSVQWLKQNQDVGVIGARLLNHDGTYQQSAFPFPTLREQVFHILRLGKLRSANLFGLSKYRHLANARHPTPVDWVSGAFLLFRKSDLDLFPQQKLHDNYFMYCEDIHWCYHFQKHLHKQVIFLPTAEVIHYGGQSLPTSKSEKRLKFYFPNLHLFLKSEKGWVYAKLFFVLLLIRYSLTTDVFRNRKYLIAFGKILFGMETQRQ